MHSFEEINSLLVLLLSWLCFASLSDSTYFSKNVDHLSRNIFGGNIKEITWRSDVGMET